MMYGTLKYAMLFMWVYSNTKHVSTRNFYSDISYKTQLPYRMNII